MNDKREKLNQMGSIIQLFTLKKERFKQNIDQLNQLMAKKNASIQTLQRYAASYAEAADPFTAKTIPIIRNNQLFFGHLQDVIRTEEKELQKLDGIKHDLVEKYKDVDKKISGLDAIYDGILQSIQIAEDKAEESANFDLAITRMGIEKKWAN